MDEAQEQEQQDTWTCAGGLKRRLGREKKYEDCEFGFSIHAVEFCGEFFLRYPCPRASIRMMMAADQTRSSSVACSSWRITTTRTTTTTTARTRRHPRHRRVPSSFSTSALACPFLCDVNRSCFSSSSPSSIWPGRKIDSQKLHVHFRDAICLFISARRIALRRVVVSQSDHETHLPCRSVQWMVVVVVVVPLSFQFSSLSSSSLLVAGGPS